LKGLNNNRGNKQTQYEHMVQQLKTGKKIVKINYHFLFKKLLIDHLFVLT